MSSHKNGLTHLVHLFKNTEQIGSGSRIQCAGRLVDKIRWGNLQQPSAGNVMEGKTVSGINQGSYANGRGGFVVGIRSSGPDRDMSTEDDNINTYPEDVD